MQKVNRLIFGLKVKQLRQKNGMSFADLQERSGLSISYLNEIEKGKKYPKKDKIIALSEALNVPFQDLLSGEIASELASLEKYFKPEIFTKIPFEFLDLDPSNILNFLSKEPLKLNVFLESLLKINKSNNIGPLEWYDAILNSYLELKKNEFRDIEQAVSNFKRDLGLKKNSNIDEQFLGKVLKNKFQVSYRYLDNFKFPALTNISVVYRKDLKTIFLNRNLNDAQRKFFLAKEIGFRVLKSKYRASTQPLSDTSDFKEVEADFAAKNFANSFLLNSEILKEKINSFISKSKFDISFIPNFLKEDLLTPQTLFERITTLLAHKYSVFYLVFEMSNINKNFILTDEFHLGKVAESIKEKNENYCRRWLPIKSMEILDSSNKKDSDFNYQICEFQNSKKKYLLFSVNQRLHLQSETKQSISIGFEIDEEFKKSFKLINDLSNKVVKVNETCQQCGIFDCQERVAAPVLLQKKALNQEIDIAVKNLK